MLTLFTLSTPEGFIGRHRDRIEFSRKFRQTAPLFFCKVPLFIPIVPLFEQTEAPNFPKVPLQNVKQVVLLTNNTSVHA